MPPKHIAVGDWIKYRDASGAPQLAEVRAFYPFGAGPTLDTTRGFVKVADVLERRPPEPSNVRPLRR
jgi:hypothetical protein